MPAHFGHFTRQIFYVVFIRGAVPRNIGSCLGRWFESVDRGTGDGADPAAGAQAIALRTSCRGAGTIVRVAGDHRLSAQGKEPDYRNRRHAGGWTGYRTEFGRRPDAARRLPTTKTRTAHSQGLGHRRRWRGKTD